MISRDPRCVFVADYHHESAMVISLLAEQGIAAEVINEATLGGLEGLTSIVPRAGLKGMEVWVRDLAQVDAAHSLLARHNEEVKAIRANRERRTGNEIFECPACHARLVFPAAQQGTVQSCTECGEFVDVPDPDDDTEWPDDFGKSEYDGDPEGGR